jgi:hypothetical protein
MKKSEILNLFESFSSNQLQELIDDKSTYVVKKFKEFVSDSTEYSEITQKIRNYDVHKFKYVESYCILIYPDRNFLELIEIYNKDLENEMDLNLVFEISLNKSNLNLIDIPDGLPVNLRNLGLGYKLYKLVIEKNGFITSNRFCNDNAKNIWYYLMLDRDLYCYTSYVNSGVIDKKLNNKEIKKILDNIQNLDVYFDDELQEKIIEIYGSVDIYKQKN